MIRQTLQSMTKKSLAQVKQLKTQQNQKLCLLLSKDRKSINESGFELLRWNKHINRVSVAKQLLHPSLSKILVSDGQKQQKRQTTTQKTRKKRKITLTKSKNTQRRQMTTNPFLVQLFSMLH